MASPALEPEELPSELLGHDPGRREAYHRDGPNDKVATQRTAG